MEEQDKEKGEKALVKNKPAKSNNESMMLARTVNNLDVFNPDDRAKLELYLKSVMSSEKCAIKTIQDGIAIYSRAKELGLPFTSCSEHIGVINGKTTLDVHLIKALLLKAAVTWECKKDYIALYEYTDGNSVYVDGKIPEYCKKVGNKVEAEKFNKENEELIAIYPVKYYQDYNGNIYPEYRLNSKNAIVNNQAIAKEAISKGLVPVFRIANVPVDYETEYEFTRIIDNRVITAKGSFKYTDAVTAGLTGKDTYAKYMRILIGHRAFTYGARDIAADVVLGAMETTEAKIVNNISIDDADIIEI